MAVLRLALVIPLVGAFGLWLSLEVLRAFRTGVVNLRRGRIRARTRPWAFGVAVIVQAGFAGIVLVLLLELLRELARLPRP